jgi:hypothetical protein
MYPCKIAGYKKDIYEYNTKMTGREEFASQAETTMPKDAGRTSAL